MIRELVKSFPGGRSLFGGLTNDFAEPEFISVVGPSGCGKSTLLRLLGGVEQPSRGEIETGGRSVGFVFQEPRLLPWLSVHENIQLGSRFGPAPTKSEGTCALLRMVRLKPDAANLFPHQLSGGMRMRVALARALNVRPRLMLMDEPLAALDETTRQILQEEVRALHDLTPRLTFFVTHSLSEAVFLSDRILILGEAGELRSEIRIDLKTARREDLRNDPKFNQLYRQLQGEFRQLLTPRELM